MLPHTSRNPAEDNTVEGRLASMSSAGYLPVAKSSAELGDVLDRIKVGWGGWVGGQGGPKWEWSPFITLLSSGLLGHFCSWDTALNCWTL